LGFRSSRIIEEGLSSLDEFSQVKGTILVIKVG